MAGSGGKKILLGLMPFWSPLTPPLGISVLKSYLRQHGFDVAAYDFNTDDNLWEILDRYFKILKETVPEHKQSNFYMVGFDVLSNHLVAYLHQSSSTRKSQYWQLVKLLVSKNYFVEVDDHVVTAMDKVVSEFYTNLKQSIFTVLERIKPDVFGLSVYSPNLGPTLFAFKRVKEKYPHIETIMGGGVFADNLEMSSPNFSNFLENTEPYIDVIMVGEGEILLKRYLERQLESGKRVYSLQDIERESLDLSTVLIPDFSELKLSFYLQMATYATRSCPFQCKFCSETVQWGRFRKKNAEQIVDEIDQIRRENGGKLFLFGDSLVNPVIEELSRQLLKKRSDIYWDAYLRTDPAVCDPVNTDLWRQGGFYRARLGIESGSQRVLDLMNKKMSVQQMKKALSALANSGIKTTAYWVIGYPGETEADFRETLNLVTEMKDELYEVDWHPFYFFPQGQVSSHRWSQEFEIEPLYPEEFSDMLLTQTWILNTNPGREEIYDRLNRFGEACKKNGILNPYSLYEIYQADLRWKKLHAKAKDTPSILELHNQKWLAGHS
jgi:radical SAM superfamily enzyme YgiQ (UPF0313 family)